MILVGLVIEGIEKASMPLICYLDAVCEQRSNFEEAFSVNFRLLTAANVPFTIVYFAEGVNV